MKAYPFEPFTLLTADGREVHVPHPELISSSPAFRTVIVHKLAQDGSEDWDVLDVFLLVGAKVHKSAESAGT